MRSRNRTLRTAFVVIGAALAVSALAMAAGPGQHGPGAGGAALASPSNLTAQQLQQLEQVRSDLEQKTLPLERQVESKRMELDALMASSNPDLDRVRALRGEIRQLQSKLDDAWFEASAQVSQFLTPQQRAQYADSSAWLMGEAGWYDGWSCPWDRGPGCDWYDGGNGRYTRNWRGRDTYARGYNRWRGSRLGGHTGCCW